MEAWYGLIGVACYSAIGLIAVIIMAEDTRIKWKKPKPLFHEYLLLILTWPIAAYLHINDWSAK